MARLTLGSNFKCNTQLQVGCFDRTKYNHLSSEERAVLMLGLSEGKNPSVMARLLGRSTVRVKIRRDFQPIVS